MSVPRYRRMRGPTAFMAAVGLLLAPVGISAASTPLPPVAPAAPKTVSLGVTTPCTGFFVGKPKKTNTVASVFAVDRSASGPDKNRLFYQTMAMVGDFSTGGVFVESKAIRVSRFFRDSRGRQHLRFLALGSMKVVGGTVTFTVRGGQSSELMRTTRGTAIRKVKVSGKVFVVYDFVAPRRAHIDTVYLDAINPKARTSGKEPVVHRTKFRTAGRSFDFGPDEFKFNLQSDVSPNSHCVLMARSYTFTSDGSDRATNRLDVSATKTAKSLLVSTTVRKPGKTRLTLCSSSNKKTYDLTHAIVSRTTNGNQLVTCVSPVGNRFEGSNLYALDTTLPSSSPSAGPGAPRPFMAGSARSKLRYAQH